MKAVFRPGSVRATVWGMLKDPAGASLAMACQSLGKTPENVRAVMGEVAKQLDLRLVREPNGDRYWLRRK